MIFNNIKNMKMIKNKYISIGLIKILSMKFLLILNLVKNQYVLIQKKKYQILINLNILIKIMKVMSVIQILKMIK